MTAAQNPLTPEPVVMHGRSVNIETPERALIIAAHPDDAEFGAGATTAKWSKAGCEVSIMVCTDGSKGTWDPGADEVELIATRQSEQRAAMDMLGATGEVVFLGYTDGELESSLEARAQVALWIRRLRPTVVLGHDPWKRYRLHPDHRHAGLLITEAVVAARDPKFFPDQGVDHHRPELMLLFEADAPDHAEDASGYLEAKYQALLRHESQYETTMGIDFKARVEAKLKAAGEATGFKHAEVFKLIDDL